MNILLVEDNPADVRLVREAIADSSVQAELHCATDGAQAIDFLRQTGGYTDAPLPDLVLLDLNLPGIGGKEVLREIKADPALRRIPVVVLTSSTAPRDVLDAYDAHVNSYMVKPSDYDDFLSLVTTIESYWLESVQLPSRIE